MQKIDQLLIVGVGLIGGSLALSLKQHGVVGKITGVGRSQTNLEAALELGVVDEIQQDLRQAAAGADMICLAVPVNTMASKLEEIKDVFPDHCVITDVGSVKGGVSQDAVSILGSRANRFVPGHPIAGKEKSGVQSAFPELFENHKVVITPLHNSDSDAVDRVRDMWTGTGADVVEMDIEVHDRVLSITSHLPHVLAYTTVQQMANSSDKERCYEMAAGGFYDFTRIASGDPEMWRDICLMNKQELLKQLYQYQSDLSEVITMIEKEDGEAIESLFSSSQKARSILVERRQHRKG